MATLFFYLPECPQSQHRSLNQVFGGSRVALDREVGLQEDPTSGNRSLCHSPQAREPSRQKNSATKSHLTSDHLTLQIVILLIIVRVKCLSERPTKFCAIPKKKWRQNDNHSIYQFKQRDRLTGLEGDSEGVWKLWLKLMTISLNTFYLWYFKIFFMEFW